MAPVKVIGAAAQVIGQQNNALGVLVSRTK